MNTTLLIALGAIVAIAAIVFLSQKIAKLTAEKSTLQGKLETQEALLKAQQAANSAINEERQKAFDLQKKQMEESFKLLSEQNSNSLRHQSAESITELLKPIQEKFEKFDRSIQDSQIKAGEQNATMKSMIKQMMEHTVNVGNEARNLANALTGHSKVQGDFGEMLLVDLLKASGLEEGIHFFVQGVMRDEFGHEIKSENGAVMIPDVIVNYPDGSQVIIDSKVSLNAFVSYCNSQTVEERKRFAKEHIDSITRHIDELKTKDYASYIDDNHKKVDYNIMFIPMENAYRLMLDEAPTLWQRAKDAKVLIVSQQNLMIVLNMILVSWKHHNQERNIAEVYKTAAELMSQIKAWLESYQSVGEYLDKARKAYDDSKVKLTESNQSVLRKIDKLERLKITPKRSNAKIKAGARMVGGQESVIPTDLAVGLDSDEPEESELPDIQ